MFENLVVKHVKSGQKEVRKKEKVVSEVPLTIMLNKEELTTLLCSPDKLKELMYGFLMVEGFISSKKDVLMSQVNEKTSIGYIETKKHFDIEKYNKKRIITTGCARGQTFYNYNDLKNCELVESSIKIPKDSILRLMKEFQKMSETFKETGGVHSAALCDEEKIIAFSEDIGRHNAIDKIIGEVIIKGGNSKDKFLITSGRISSEIVIKSARLKVPVIVSRSAPTALAVKLAKQLNITLVGFARGSRMNVYSQEKRIV